MTTYMVAGWPKVAVYIVGPQTEQVEDAWEHWDEECSELPCENPLHWAQDEEPEYRETGMVRVVMVGDDREHIVDPDDLTEIDDLDYCAECGQIGCRGDFRDRDDA